MLDALGEWADIYKEALYFPRPSKIEIENKENNFILKGDNCYYLFVFDLEVSGNVIVELSKGNPNCNNTFTFDQKIKSIKWLDSNEDFFFTQTENKVNVVTPPQLYGENLVVRIAKIEI